MKLFIDILTNKTIEVFFALFPLLIIFVLFQFIKLKLPKAQFIIVLRGLFLTYAGLVLFLSGVDIGFIYIGNLIGQTLGQLAYNWILIPIGFMLGFVVTFAEPAIQVLIIEVEKVSAGSINRKIMLYFLSLGVAVAVALSMYRMINNISLWYFILPGYLIILILMWFVSPIFVSIAYDSGGVVTGPMIATFLLSLFVGSSTVISGSNPMTDAFGMIAMVAMVPIFSILLLGVMYTRAEAKMSKKDKKNKEDEITVIKSNLVLLGVLTEKEYINNIMNYIKNLEPNDETNIQETFMKINLEEEISDSPKHGGKVILFQIIDKNQLPDAIDFIQKKVFLNDSTKGTLFTLGMDTIDKICHLYHFKKNKDEK